MKRNIEHLNELSENVIGAAIEVHKTLGPGLLESVYQKALCYELKKMGIPFSSEKELDVIYKGHKVGTFRTDIIVDGKLILELKSVERMDPLFKAQLLSYMRMGNFQLGLLINFNSKLLKNGIKRFIL